MKRVLTAVALIPLVLLVVFLAPLWLFALVVGVVVLLCLHEYLKIVKGYGIIPVRLAAYALSVFLILVTSLSTYSQYLGVRRYASYFSTFPALYWAILLIPLIFGIPIVFRRDLGMALGACAASAFGVLYVAMPLTLLIQMRWTPGRSVLIILVLLTVWAGDIAAYYAGKAFGRHKLAPVVSPNKTWEGAIASLLVSFVIVFLVLRFHRQLSVLFVPHWTFYTPPETDATLPRVLTLGLITNIAAQFGDLFESAIKRGAQVKDSGSILPGHGGLLDRIDALLFAIPAVWYYATLHTFLIA